MTNRTTPENITALRDYFAGVALQANMQAWNSELSAEYRVQLIEDMMKRYGNVKTYDAIAMVSYEMADAMLRARGEA